MTCHHCRPRPTTARRSPRRLCDDCANDLRRNAEPKNYRTGIFGVTIQPL